MIRLAPVALFLCQAGGLALTCPDRSRGGEAQEGRVEGVKPKYATEKSGKDKVFTEMTMGIKIEGSDVMANFVRSMHPFLSIERMVARAGGTRQVTGPKKVRVENDEARVELRYDDENHEYDYTKGDPMPGAQDKLKQMLFFFAAGGKNYSLSAEGEYKSDDATQDHNGEAMDLIANAITRMPDKPVKEGDTYVKEFTGLRSEKNKKGKFAFKQSVKVEKIEEKDGKRVVTLASDLTGELKDAKDPSAEENWTKCEGKTKTRIEVETGRVLYSEGSGKVTGYFRNTAENGARQELTLTFSISGKLEVK